MINLFNLCQSGLYCPISCEIGKVSDGGGGLPLHCSSEAKILRTVILRLPLVLSRSF